MALSFLNPSWSFFLFSSLSFAFSAALPILKPSSSSVFFFSLSFANIVALSFLNPSWSFFVFSSLSFAFSAALPLLKPSSFIALLFCLSTLIWSFLHSLRFTLISSLKLSISYCLWQVLDLLKWEKSSLNLLPHDLHISSILPFDKLPISLAASGLVLWLWQAFLENPLLFLGVVQLSSSIDSVLCTSSSVPFFCWFEAAFGDLLGLTCFLKLKLSPRFILRA